jgi:hypothetical protein
MAVLVEVEAFLEKTSNLRNFRLEQWVRLNEQSKIPLDLRRVQQ